jgi:excisionase family DNA binding protein
MSAAPGAGIRPIGNPFVIPGGARIPARVCALIVRSRDLPKLWAQLRALGDSEAELAIEALLLAAAQHGGAARGTVFAAAPAPAANSDETAAIVTTAEAAEILGISPRGVRKACQEGRLPSTQNGRDHLIERTKLIEYLDQQNSWKATKCM